LVYLLIAMNLTDLFKQQLNINKNATAP